MHTSLQLTHYDLVTPDGQITEIGPLEERRRRATVFIDRISPNFVGFELDADALFFNLKSTLAQLGLEGIGQHWELDRGRLCAQVEVELCAYGRVGASVLSLLEPGALIGKLFGADPRRRVRDPDYLFRMFGRSDRWGDPLLLLGGLQGSRDLILDRVEGRTVAYLTLQNGRLEYDETAEGFLPTVVKALIAGLPVRKWVGLHQQWKAFEPRNVGPDEMLLVRTLPLHIRTVFARVVPELLSKGYRHTSASILQPDTQASGDVYELYGDNKREITDIPLEFYTLEPYRENIFFKDRDQLQSYLEDSEILFNAFETAPKPLSQRAAVFIVKGDQLLNLRGEDWIAREIHYQDFPGSTHETRQALMVQRFIEQHPSYPFLQSIDKGLITSQGVLFTRYFPSPLLKRMLLSNQVQYCLKGVYFEYASQHYQDFFSAEDRSLLNDLEKFAIPVFWVDRGSKRVLRYTQKPGYDTGLFVPLAEVKHFLESTVFGIYGSNLLEGDFEEELKVLMRGILQLKQESDHPLLKPHTPLSLVTGGGPGAMEVGNRVAKEFGMLSCANIVDFRPKDGSVVNEQLQNPYIEAKMTYRLDKLVERQAEFNLDFPIFLVGGIGTDFEYALEEVRRKVGMVKPTPVLLFGEKAYWREKITGRYQCNLQAGTIRGSEWVSNCFYCVQTGEQALQIYQKYFKGELKMGKGGPLYERGFATLDSISV